MTRNDNQSSARSDCWVSPVWLEPGDLDSHWAVMGRF